MKLINKYMGNNIFNRSMLKSILYSILIVLLLLIMYTLFPCNYFFEKLVQGEVLAGLIVAFPTLKMWENNELSKKIELHREEYRNLIEIINNKDSQITNLEVEVLKDLLHEPNSDSFMNYKTIFLLLQNKLQSETEIQLKDNFIKDIRKINFEILNKMNSSEVNELMKKILEVKFIDFSVILNNRELLELTDRKANITFINCCFSEECFTKSTFLQSSSINVCFENCIIEIDSLNLLEEYDFKYELKNSYYYDEQGFLREYTEKTELSKSEKIDNNDIEEKIKIQDKIFEERDLSKFGSINQYIIKQKVFDITLKSNNQDSINSKIFTEIKNILKHELKDIENKDIFVSRSKSYVQNTTDGANYNWRSWNVLPESQAKDESKKLYIFAVQKNKNDNKNYVCVILDKNNMNKLLKLKKLSSDNRYYFYFASKKLYS